MTHYHQVPTVIDVGAMTDAVRWIQDKVWVDRLEATIEAHTLAAAQVRENCTIPGTSVRTAWLCRDKPSMKEVLRAAGVPTAASTAAENAARGVRVRRRGRLPADPQAALRRGRAGHRPGRQQGRARRGARRASAARASRRSRSRSSSRATRASTTPSRSTGARRSTSSRTTTRTSSRRCAPGGSRRSSSRPTGSTRRRTTPSCARWAPGSTRRSASAPAPPTWSGSSGPKGLRFSEIGCRPPGVGAWDLYSAGNDLDLYREWANAIVHGHIAARPSRQFATGIVALRPDRDGTDHRLLRRRGDPGPLRRVGDRRAPALARHPDPAGRGRLHGQRVRADAPPGLRHAAGAPRRRGPHRPRARRVTVRVRRARVGRRSARSIGCASEHRIDDAHRRPVPGPATRHPIVEGRYCTFLLPRRGRRGPPRSQRIVGLPGRLPMRRLPDTDLWYVDTGAGRRTRGSSTRSRSAGATTSNASTTRSTRSVVQSARQLVGLLRRRDTPRRSGRMPDPEAPPGGAHRPGRATATRWAASAR